MATILISESLLTAWKQMELKGDKVHISNESGISYFKVSQAFRTKKTDSETYEAIKKFYLERSENLKSQNSLAENLNVA